MHRHITLLHRTWNALRYSHTLSHCRCCVVFLTLVQLSSKMRVHENIHAYTNGHMLACKMLYFFAMSLCPIHASHRWTAHMPWGDVHLYTHMQIHIMYIVSKRKISLALLLATDLLTSSRKPVLVLTETCICENGFEWEQQLKLYKGNVTSEKWNLVCAKGRERRVYTHLAYTYIMLTLK